MSLEWWLSLLLLLSSFVVLLAIGLPVAFCFMLINLIGVFSLWGGGIGLEQLILSLYASIASFSFLPLPLFILMGEVLFRSGIASLMIDAVDKWLGRLQLGQRSPGTIS